MEPKQKKALIIIAALFALMTLAAVTIDLTATAPPQSADALISAWVQALRQSDSETLVNLACAPDAAINSEAEIAREILAVTVSTRTLSTTAYPDISITRVQSEINLSQAVNGKTIHEMIVLVRSSGQEYCVWGFALDRAFWPRRQQAQEQP